MVIFRLLSFGPKSIFHEILVFNKKTRKTKKYQKIAKIGLKTRIFFLCPWHLIYDLECVWNSLRQIKKGLRIRFWFFFLIFSIFYAKSTQCGKSSKMSFFGWKSAKILNFHKFNKICHLCQIFFQTSENFISSVLTYFNILKPSKNDC